MTWLAWRHTRTPLAVALAALAAVAVVALAEGRADNMPRPWLSALVIVAPGLLGAFWGAPLVAAELESGSFRLAWTQDVSRTRWLAWRLVVTGLTAMATAGLASWLVTWWAGPLDRTGLDQFGSFDARDIVPLGYAAFAFALGALFGLLLRRTVPALAATLAVFTAVRLAFRLLVRPSLLPPVTQALALNPATTGYGSSGFLPFMPASTLQPAAPDLPNAWVTSVAIVNGKGDALTTSVLSSTCPGLGHGGGGGGAANPFAHSSNHVQASQGVVSSMQACATRIAATYHELITYQPANRYWPLQWFEFGFFFAAALLLAAACAWRLRRIG
jgi:hypothetical protein